MLVNLNISEYILVKTVLFIYRLVAYVYSYDDAYMMYVVLMASGLTVLSWLVFRDGYILA